MVVHPDFQRVAIFNGEDIIKKLIEKIAFYQEPGDVPNLFFSHCLAA